MDPFGGGPTAPTLSHDASISGVGERTILVKA